MHELGIVMNVIKQVEKAAAEHHVKQVCRVTMELGEVSSVVPELFEDCFEWAKKRTECLRDAELEMVILEGISYCRACKSTYSTTAYGRKCPRCGGGDTYLVTGDEINIKQIQVV